MVILKKLKKYYKIAKNRIYRFTTLKIIYPNWYRWCARTKIEKDKVVFIEFRYTEISDSIKLLYAKLQKEYNFKLTCCFLRTAFSPRKEHFFRCLDMIREIATAKYVFTYDTTTVVSSCSVRKGTKIVQLWHGCGAFKKFGFSTADLIFGDSRKDQIKYPAHRNYSFVTVSSPEAIWVYAEAMRLEEHKDIILPIGVSRTDIFFDLAYLEQAHKNLLDLIPEAEGKKILLYAPTFRGSVAQAQPPSALDIGMLEEAFRDDYILLIKQHPVVKNIPSVPEKWSHFAFDMTVSMTIEDLICVADICISDYSSLVFEYSLLEKPMLFFAYDLKEYFDWRGFYYNYDNTFLPGPIVTTNREIIDCIKHPERFDLGQVKKFKEKFMASCDGHATERILQKTFGDELQKYKKKGPSKKRIAWPKFKRYESRLFRSWIKQHFYNNLCGSYNINMQQKPREDKVVFLLQNRTEFSVTAQAIKHKLAENGNFCIEEFRLDQKNTWQYIKNCRKVVKMFAAAKYIITDEDIILFGWLPEEINEKIVRCCSPYDFLLHDQDFFGPDEKKGVAFPIEEVYREKALSDKKGVLFNAYAQLDRQKKILLCAGRTALIKKISWQELIEYLSDEYNILVFSPNLRVPIPKHLEDKIILLDSQWLLDDCIILADILIGESDLRVLQGLCERKKVLFWGTKPDNILLKIDDDFIRNYYKKTVCTTTMDLIHKILSEVEIEENNINNITQKYFYNYTSAKRSNL